MSMSNRAAALFAALLCCLALLAPRAALANENEAAKAMRAAQQFRVQLAQNGVQTPAQLKQQNTLIRDLQQLLLRADAGYAALTNATRQRIEETIDALSDLPLSDVATGVVRAPAANGTLSGTIVDNSTGLPLSTANQVTVQAIDFTTQQQPTGAGVVSSVGNNASGGYTLTLPPGKYHLRTFNAQGFINQAFGFGTCYEGIFCPRYVGTIVTVPDGGTVTGINFSMDRGARISGTVRRADTNAPLANHFISVVERGGSFVASAATDASGNYTITAGLPAGSYRVFTNSVGAFMNEAFHPSGTVWCGGVDCSQVASVQGAAVTLTGTSTTTGIDFSLEAAAGVSGQLTDAATLTAITDPNAFIYMVSEDRRTFDQINVDGAGNYSFTNVRPGNYRVIASAPNYLGQVYVSAGTTRECVDVGSCDPLDIGGTITVAAPGSSVSGINLALPRGAGISGQVRNASTLTGIADSNVHLLHLALGLVASGTTDASGNFSIQGAPAGVYRVLAQNQAAGFASTLFGGVGCNNNLCFDNASGGALVTLGASGIVSGTNIDMPQGGTITGTISDATSGGIAPRNRTRIELFDSLGRIAAQEFQSPTAPFTSYTAAGLQPGAYKAIFASSGVVGWIDTSFGGAPCPRGGCDLSVLPTVFATAGATTAGINISLPRGPRVAGVVLDGGSGDSFVPLAFSPAGVGAVAFYNSLDRYAAFAQIGAKGVFLSRTGLSPGTYFMSTFLTRTTLANGFPIGNGFVDRVYNGLDCPYLSCTVTTGTPITVAASDLTGFSITLNPGGAIAGTVTNNAGGAPLRGVQIKAFNGTGRLVGVARSNLLGRYRMEGIPSGSYFVLTENELGFQDELYNNLACEPFCNPVTGASVAVTAPVTTGGIDFGLNESASISGTVTNASATPQANVPVEIYGQIGNLLRTTTTNTSGQFRFADLAAGRFYVRTRDTSGRTDDVYWQAGNPNNTSATEPDCVGQACQVRRGTPIDLSAGGSFTSANLVLAAPGVISGQVTNQGTSAAMSGVQVALYDARGALVNTVSSGVTGNYSFNALAAGNYFAVTRGTPGFIDEAFNNLPCSASCDGLLGLPIVVTAGATTPGVNFALSVGASISGTVRDPALSPVVGTTVQVYDSNGIAFAQTATNPSGNYEVTNIADGTFFVRTRNDEGYIDELFNNRPCNGYCDILSGNGVVIAGGVGVGLVNFDLANGGSINGRVTRAAGGAGVGLAEVQAFTTTGFLAGRAMTDATGLYTIAGLPDGNYKVRTANTAGLINQVYRTPTPLTCSPTPCALSGGNTIAISGGAAIASIDFALAAGGTISGTAADLFNNPLPSGNAVLFDSNGIEITTTPVNAGLFEFNGLANGTYYVLIENSSGLIDLLYANVPCPAGACNITALGTPITLSVRAPNQVASVSNIDLRLPTGRQVSGRVRAGASPAALADATVYIFNSTGVLVGEGVSDGLGDYLTTGSFQPGTYFAATTNGVSRGASPNWVNELYNNRTCMLDCNVTAGDAITVTSGGSTPLTGISFDLIGGSSLSGRVRDTTTLNLQLVTVQVFDSAGVLAGSFQTNSQGQYKVDGLLPGTYFARTVNSQGYVDILFGGTLCNPNCTPTSGTPITVQAGGLDTPNIDFTLGRPDALFNNGFE
jgi:hypothetical protein